MKKYSIYIHQVVHETMTFQVMANTKKEAEELAEKMRVDADSGEWDGCVSEVFIDVKKIKRK